MKGWCQRLFVPDEIQSTIVDHVLVHGMSMREAGQKADLQGFYTSYYYTSILYIQYNYSTQKQYFR